MSAGRNASGIARRDRGSVSVGLILLVTVALGIPAAGAGTTPTGERLLGQSAIEPAYNAANGNLSRATGKRIYLVHGARDWMFPVETARIARDRLKDAGAEIVYREIDDLSHTYPRDENARILEWFDPALSIPRHDSEV